MNIAVETIQPLDDFNDIKVTVLFSEELTDSNGDPYQPGCRVVVFLPKNESLTVNQIKTAAINEAKVFMARASSSAARVF